MELRYLALALALLTTSAEAGPRLRPATAPDPGGMYYEAGNVAKNVYQTTGTVRTLTINPALKTLILISAGQSLAANTGTGSYSPTNSTVLDDFNSVTGQLYAATNPLIGCYDAQNNFILQLADTLVTNGIFNRVIIVPVAISGTTVAWWAGSAVSATEPGGYYRGVLSAVNKLAARGVTPSTTGTTWAVLWNQGESDTQASTSQVSYTASFNTMFSLINAAIPGVRWFVAKESWFIGAVSSAVQNAQVALVNNTQIFSAGNMDSLDATNRQGDNTHLNATGQAAAAALTYTAIHASGSPF